MVVGRHDADYNGKWSWSLYPQMHPNGRNVVFDMYLRNTTHEISLREEDIYPIDGLPIFEKPDFWSRTFPNGWCANEVRPSRKDGDEIFNVLLRCSPHDDPVLTCCDFLMSSLRVCMFLPARSGICEYLEKKEYYHVAAVFGLRRVELYVGMYVHAR